MENEKWLVGRQAEIYRLLKAVMEVNRVYQRKDLIQKINQISDTPYTESLFNGSFNYLRDGKAGIVQVGRGRYVFQGGIATEEELTLETIAGLTVWTKLLYEPDDPAIQTILRGLGSLIEKIGLHYCMDSGTMDIYRGRIAGDVCDPVWEPPDAGKRLEAAQRLLAWLADTQEFDAEAKTAVAYLSDFRETCAAWL